MNPDKFCIVTISWARNEDEEKLLKTALSQLASFHLPVFITDGGSTPSFVEFLHSFPNFHVLTTDGKGVYAQARNSLLTAYETGIPFLIYTEPDKAAFFAEGLNKLLSVQLPNEQTGICNASRSAKGFATFPAFQQMTETTINNCCKELTGKDYDFTYGPFLLNRKLVPYLHKVKEDIGWGWRPFLFVLAQRLGLTLDAMIDDFVCPPEQRNDDPKERVYRMKQLEQNIRGIVLGSSVEL